MSVLGGMLRRAEAPPQARRGYGDEPGWLWEHFGGNTATGIAVTQESSLRSPAVLACVRVLTETVSTLPLVLFKRLERGKERAPNHYLYELLHDQPNPLMTSAEWLETLMGHLALWGNAYCEIEFNAAGRVQALWPLRPNDMREVRRTGEGLAYVYQLPDGKEIILPGERVFHLRGLSSDGITGYSPIGLARQAVALGMAAEEFGARFFGNDARPGGVLQHPGILGDDAYKRIRDSWESRHAGLSKSHRIAILEEGMTYTQIGIPPQDAQFLETRKFQLNEIARIFRVPPHMIGDLERSTNNNIEHQGIEFVTLTLRPWLVRWEKAINTRLLSSSDRKRYFAEFVVEGLLRGDTASRFQAYAVGRQNGWLSANDIRELENQNPIENGDVYLVPMNMVPADMVGQTAESPADDGGVPDVATNVDTNTDGNGRSYRMANGVEIRAEQWEAASARHRLQIAFLPLFEDVAGRLTRREANDVANAARRMLGKGDVERFTAWLETFYEELGEVSAAGYEPVVNAYASQVAELAAREVGKDGPELTSFVAAYVAALALRQAGHGMAKIRELLAAFGDEALEAIEAEMEQRKESRPGRIAREESVRANNALAVAAYMALGVSKKRWVTFGDNCPYCNDLAGRSVGLEAPFLAAGIEFMPLGAERPLKVDGHVGHAPAHEGCDCMVVAG